MHAAEKLRRARRAAGLSLRELAARGGTSHSTIAAYESGRTIPRADTLDRLLAACGFKQEVRPAPEVDRDSRRGTPDEEFAQVMTLVDAVGPRDRSRDGDWDVPRFRMMA